MAKLLGIIVGIALFFVFGLFLTRIWGLSQTFVPFDHPFLDQSSRIVESGSIEKIPMIWSEEELLAYMQKEPETNIFALQIRITLDNQFFLLNPEASRHFLGENLGKKLSHFTLKELQEKIPGLTVLESLLANHLVKPKYLLSKDPVRLLVRIEDNVENIDQVAIEVFDRFHLAENSLFYSPVGIVLESLKKSRPRWLYGSSQDDWVRMLAFDSLGILSAVPFKKDVFVAPVRLHNRPIVNLNLVSEMRRRHKKIFLGPIATSDEVEIALSMKPDGLIISKYPLE